MYVKKANAFLYAIYRLIFKPYLFFKYRLRFDRSVAKKLKSPCIIISNHVTVMDPFMVGSLFRFPVNFVASDGILAKSLTSRLIMSLARIIPIKKGAADATAVKNIIGVIRKKGSVVIFPEGNATFFGETGNFRPTTGRLIKKLNVPLVVVEVRGGYNTDPRWKSKKTNKGRMDVRVKRVVQPEELNNMTDDEINALVSKEIYFNEFEYNREKQIKFKGRHKAEYLESALFTCLSCGSFKDMKSDGNDFYCGACGARVRINETGFFDKVHNADKLPDNILDYSKVQLDMVKNTNFEDFIDNPVFGDDNIKVFKVTRGAPDELLCAGSIAMYGDRIEAGNRAFRVDDIEDITVQRMKRLQIYMKDGSSFAVIVTLRTSVFKYMVCYYKIRHDRNNEEDEFYGY